MCLGVPGKVLHVEKSAVGLTMGQVSFGGIVKEICLAYTPDVRAGDYVLVHVGFSISRIDEQQAIEVFQTLEQMGELGDLPASRRSDPPAGSS